MSKSGSKVIKTVISKIPSSDFQFHEKISLESKDKIKSSQISLRSFRLENRVRKLAEISPILVQFSILMSSFEATNIL